MVKNWKCFDFWLKRALREVSEEKATSSQGYYSSAFGWLLNRSLLCLLVHAPEWQ